MSEQATSESLGPRAEWQQGIAAFTLDKIVRESLPEAIALTSDQTIESHLALAGQQSSPQATAIVKASRAMSPLLEYYSSRDQSQLIHRVAGEGLRHTFLKYTYQSSIMGAVREGISTQLYFPINLLTIADSRRPSHLPPVFASVRDIATIYQSSWFRKVVALAATGANGSWEDLSFTPAHRKYPQIAELNKQAYYLRFVYDTTEGATTFDFSPEAKASLKQAMEEKNTRAQAQNYSHETWTEGSSSGCPVFRTRPLFQNPDNVSYLAEVYDLPPEEITKAHHESAISFGLLLLADYLERAAAVDEIMHGRRKEKAAPASGQLALQASF